MQGGEGRFLFGLGVGYNGISGVMKESLREIISGNIDLIYRMEKFQFSNKFSINVTDIENPVVPFQAYAEANISRNGIKTGLSRNGWRKMIISKRLTRCGMTT